MLLTGAFIGGFVNGLAGFGTALFALGFFLVVMPPLQAVATIVAVSLITGALGLITVHSHVMPHKSKIFRLIVPGVIGVPFGVAALSFLSVEHLRLLVAILLLLYGGYFILRADLPQLTGRYPVLDGIVGFMGGVLGGLAALSGALPTMWYAMRDMNKLVSRTILQCYNLTLLAVTFALLIAKGAFDREAIILCLIAIPVALVAARLGLSLFKRLSTKQFRRLLVILTFLSGAVMLYRIIAG